MTTKLQFEMEDVPCPLCGAEKYETFRMAKDRLGVTDRIFTSVKCENCDLVYQNPRVTPATIGIFYPKNYFTSRPGRNLKQKTIAEQKVTLKCRLIERFAPQPGKLLEIGSANGDFLVGMRELGWQVQGVEISSDAAEFSKREHGLKVFSGELLARPDDDEHFDVIVMWATLSHIPNPVPTVSYAAKMLAPKGKLVISGANIDSYAAKKMQNNWGHLDLPRHYCLWSPSTLGLLYEIAGLCIEDIVHHDDIFNSNLILPWLASFVRIGEPPFTGVSGLAYRVVRKISNNVNFLLTKPILTKARKVGQGGIITVIGTKK